MAARKPRRVRRTRDARIAELEGQVAEATKNAETAEQLRGEIAELKAQGESDRIDFKLQLASVRNVKAARALLSDHDNDLAALQDDVVDIDGNLSTAALVTVVESTVTTAIDDLDELADLDF